MKSLDHSSFLSNFQDHLMKLILTLLLILSTLSSPSFGEDESIRVLEDRFHHQHLITRLCIGGYEFVTMCPLTHGGCLVGSQISLQFQQTIGSNGGGVSC